MPKVTDLKKQKRTTRVNVYIDDKFSFGASLEILLKHGIKKDKEIGDDDLRKLKDESGFEKIYGKVLRFSTIRPRSEKEIKLWFKRKGVPQDLQNNLFGRLKRLGLADDSIFASWWIEQRNQFRPKSKRALFLELRQKGIERDLINSILEEKSDISEIDLAKKVVMGKLKRVASLSREDAGRYLFGLLSRRGFSWETARKAIDETLEKE